MTRRGTRAGRVGERGFTLIEAIIVTAVSVTVLLVVMSMIEQASLVTMFTESNNDMTILSQRPMNDIQRDLLQSKDVFVASTDGNAYLAKVKANIPSSAAATTTILPTLNAGGGIAPDSNTTYTGNCLLVARQIQPISIAIAADGTYPALTFKADRYQFEFFYLKRDTTRNFAGNGYSVDLYRWRSAIYADYFQLTTDTLSLSATQRTALSTALRATTPAATAPNLQIAWSPGQPIASAFWTIDANLNFPVANQIAAANVTIPMKDVKTILPELFNARISGKMAYTVGYRAGTAPGTVIPGVGSSHPVPRFFDSTLTTTPVDCGFEVQVVGQAGYRQVMTRLVIYANYMASRYESQEGFGITAYGGLTT